jgi:hypothetical protein
MTLNKLIDNKTQPMKKSILILLAGFIFQIPTYSQITNHTPIDEIDYSCILGQQGISFFKNKFALKKGEYIDISIDVYEKGKFIENYNLLNSALKAFGVDLSAGNHFDYQVSKMDTTIYHRFYFFKQKEILKIQINVPGMSGSFERNISKVKEGEIYQILDTPNNLEKKTILGYYYGIYKKNTALECPSGLNKEEMIKTYDIVIVIYGEKKKE